MRGEKILGLCGQHRAVFRPYNGRLRRGPGSVGSLVMFRATVRDMAKEFMVCYVSCGEHTVQRAATARFALVDFVVVCLGVSLDARR